MMASSRRPVESRSLLDGYSARLGSFVDHRRARIALSAAKDKAEAHSRAKSEFIANMSHELRTPLNAVIGFASILQDPDIPLNDEKRREYAGDIQAAGKHLLAVVNDILDFSKLQSSTMQIDAEPVCIDAEVHAVMAMVGPQARKKGVALDVEVLADMPDLTTDAQRVRQIVLNIISNAIKFTGTGGTVTAICSPAEPRAIAVKICDTGVGMSPDELEIALAPFGQVQNVFSRREGGSGIGLPLTRALCDLLGASFAIDSEAGVGTTVTLIFRDLPFDSDPGSRTPDLAFQAQENCE